MNAGRAISGEDADDQDNDQNLDEREAVLAAETDESLSRGISRMIGFPESENLS